jgi:hypothetical protein
MSIIEFQLNTSAFLAAQRNALRSLQICRPTPSPEGVLLDKVEFGNNTIRHNVDESFAVFFDSLTSDRPGEDVWGYQTQIAQDVTVYVTTMQDVLSHPNQPPATIVALHGTLVFDLEFSPHDEDCSLTTRLKALEPGPLPALPPGLPVTLDQLLARVESLLRAAIPQPTVPAGLTQLTKLFAKFLNAGISVDSQLQRIALRAQIGGSNPDIKPRWEAFFKGNFPDRLAGADWSVYIDAGLINEFVKAKINRLLDDADIDHLQTFVGCSYSNGDGKAVFTLDVEGLYDLPDPLGTIFRNVNLPVEISVAAPNTLRLRADYGDVLALIHSFDIIEFLLPSLSAGIEGLLQLAIGSALAEVNKSDIAPYCKKISSTVVECTKSVQMPGIVNGTTSILTQLNALDEGFAMAGTMHSADLSPSAIRAIVHEFKFGVPQISCSAASIALVAAFQQDAASAKVLHGQVVIDNQGATPIFLCGWTVLNDKLGAFPPASVRVDAGPASIALSLDMRTPPDAYFKLVKPYTCDLLVTTTGGTRLLQLQPPPKITREDINKLVADLLVKVGDCEKLMVPWFEKYKPGWGLSDAHVESPLDHLWQVTITGLDAGQALSLVDSSNQELVRATSRAGVPLRLSALVAPQKKNELTVVRQGPATSGQTAVKASGTKLSKAISHPQDGRGIEVGQYQLLQLGSIPLNAECQSIQTTTILSRACVLTVLPDRIHAYDLRNPRRPSPIGSWWIPGLRGVITWQSALLHFGENGFGWIDGLTGQRSAPMRCCGKPIHNATSAGSSLYAVTDDGLEIYSTGLCQTGAVAIPDARCVTRTAGKLVVGGRHGLSVHDITEAYRPKCGPYLDGIDVRRVARPLGSESGSVLASLYDGSAVLLNIAGSEIQQTASFQQAPWFAGSLRLGDLLVRIGSNGRSLEISRFAASGVV